MFTLKRTNSKNPDFIKLVEQLDANLAERDGEDHAFYNQFNSISNLNHTVVLYKDKKAVACGAIKKFDDSSMEVKRMFVPSEERGKGYATKVLKELELWTKELGNTHCILETGKRQPEAIALYEKNGYRRISNYGQYQGIENSVCFEKNVSS
ncbi:GNAT family N-acetyltransferase [Maribacter algarum]|uniref:GNAT family N-acetyltransferase n=1 Tax=Maribacter algarum (ex Zhang et al. 2020) TaxID=2578118 RepID=A0A5S3PQG2_9FLAO|nr:GNAT family N-acetyltransferase [Maribacter algarum]TMM56901.1 GNAT family N-acetyltransferase [Maribacter algarum]